MTTIPSTKNSTRILRCVEDLITELTLAKDLMKIQNNLVGYPKYDKMIVVDDEISYNDFVIALHHLAESTVPLGVIDCATINSRSGYADSDLPIDYHTPFDCFILNAIMAADKSLPPISVSTNHYRNTKKVHGEERFTGINIINIASRCLSVSKGKKYSILPIINVDVSLMDNFFNESIYYVGIIPILLLKRAEYRYVDMDYYPYLDIKGEDVGDKCSSTKLNYVVMPCEPVT